MFIKNEKPDTGRLPVHIAAIMDGNGRWAQSRGGLGFPGSGREDEQVSPRVARKDHQRRKKIGRRARRKVRD